MNRANVQTLRTNTNLKGILVLPDEGPTAFSPAATYPNKIYGLYPNSTRTWNPQGTGWSYQQQEIQIFALDADDDTDDLLSKGRENKETERYPKWAVQLVAWMNTNKERDVRTCLRRGDCYPLGGKNIYSSFNAIQSSDSVILTTATRDSTAFFHDLATGADGDISGVVAMLTAIEALKIVPVAEWVRQPMFMIFTGEAYGYIGSKSFVKDITNFTCVDQPKEGQCYYPHRTNTFFTTFSPDMFYSILDVNQVGRFPSDLTEYKIYSHTDGSAGNTSEIFAALQQAAEKTSVVISDELKTGGELPPSSLMSFLSQDKSLSGVVLAEFAEEYTSRYYQSRFDTVDTNNINFNAICNVSVVLARSIFLLGLNGTTPSNGVTLPDINVDCALVEELYTCLTINYECPLLKKLFPDLKTTSGTLPKPTNYVGVYSHRSPTDYTYSFLLNWLANMTATERIGFCNDTITCETGYCLENTCVSNYFAYTHDALSPAFEYNPYTRTMNLVDESPQWPLWTESFWQEPYMKVFMIDAPHTGTLALCIGLLELILSLACVKYASRHVSALFNIS